MHDLEDIRRRTLTLMDELGAKFAGQPLTGLGWTFAFDRARRRMGICVYRSKNPIRKEVRLSAPFCALNGWETMEDVARHEIAHAIDFEMRGRSGHDRHWKQWARRCGADPTRVHEGEDLALAPSQYVGICPRCGKQHAFYRKPKRIHACPDCCHTHNGGGYAARYRLKITLRV